ncbi:hypothetical protein QYF61_026648 [Mycteria americana]|uniref:Uncharacterized protein n=1 Tax=Mycteria americana TaxID=33587 RepID=A0AAN7ND61_MYCAM|nr:hypothetical protein QYF61_026648 [Mycteria americana]
MAYSALPKPLKRSITESFRLERTFEIIKSLGHFLSSYHLLPGRRDRPHLSATSFQAVVESDEVSPQPPFLQAEQPQVPQPLPISLVLQTLPQLRCPSLDMLQPLNVSLGVRGPKLNTAFEVRPHQCGGNRGSAQVPRALPTNKELPRGSSSGFATLQPFPEPLTAARPSSSPAPLPSPTRATEAVP